VATTYSNINLNFFPREHLNVCYSLFQGEIMSDDREVWVRGCMGDPILGCIDPEIRDGILVSPACT
jgi:hypothetical protein